MSDEKIPEYAELKAGVMGKDILEAINKSGYPFQAEVSDLIRSAINNVHIQEEWAYIDSGSGVARALDIYAEAPLWDTETARHNEAAIHPYLSLLIECKQSDLPYILFLRTNPVGDEVNFPEIFGLENLICVYLWKNGRKTLTSPATAHQSE